MRTVKRQRTEEIELPNPEKIQNARRKKTNEYLELLEGDSFKQVELKKILKKGSQMNKKKLLDNKLYFMKGINTGAFPHVRYSKTFLKLTREDLQQIDQKKRKLMRMHKLLHLRDDLESLHVSWKKKKVENSPSLMIYWIHQ